MELREFNGTLDAEAPRGLARFTGVLDGEEGDATRLPDIFPDRVTSATQEAKRKLVPVTVQPGREDEWLARNKPVEIAALRATAKTDEVRPERSIGGTAGDVVVTVLKSAVGLPQSIVGLADIPTGGRVGQALEGIGYRPGDTQKMLSGWYSEAQQAANRKVEQADGFVPTLKASVENPSTILTTIGESAGQMLGGAGIARGVMKGAMLSGAKLGPVIAGAIGEGVIGGGSAASTMREESADGYLTDKQSLSAIGSGIGTGLFGALGGKLSQKLGWGDIDTILAQGGPNAAAAGAAKLGFIKQVFGSGISEGAFQELPQSAQEHMWQNYAAGRPLTEKLGNATARGLLAGTAMGGAAGGYNSIAGATLPSGIDPIVPINRNINDIANIPSVNDTLNIRSLDDDVLALEASELIDSTPDTAQNIEANALLDSMLRSTGAQNDGQQPALNPLPVQSVPSSEAFPQPVEALNSRIKTLDAEFDAISIEASQNQPDPPPGSPSVINQRSLRDIVADQTRVVKERNALRSERLEIESSFAAEAKQRDAVSRGGQDVSTTGQGVTQGAQAGDPSRVADDGRGIFDALVQPGIDGVDTTTGAVAPSSRVDLAAGTATLRPDAVAQADGNEFDVTHAATAAVADPRSAAVNAAWKDAYFTTLPDGTVMRADLDHFAAWYEGGGVTSEVGSQYDAHGIAKTKQLGSLLNMLRNGVNGTRRFDTAPLVSPGGKDGAGTGAGLGSASGAYKDGAFIVMSGPNQTIEANGITNVLVSDAVAQTIPALQAEFPNINFIPYSQAQRELSSQISRSSSVAPVSQQPVAQPEGNENAQAAEAIQTGAQQEAHAQAVSKPRGIAPPSQTGDTARVGQVAATQLSVPLDNEQPATPAIAPPTVSLSVTLDNDISKEAAERPTPPAKLKITLNQEVKGKMVTKQVSARKAMEAADNRVARYEALRKCIG